MFKLRVRSRYTSWLARNYGGLERPSHATQAAKEASECSSGRIEVEVEDARTDHVERLVE